MKLQSSDKAVTPQWRCYCLFLLLTTGIGMVGTATADEVKEVSCRRVGAMAQAIAEARDQGKTVEDAIAIATASASAQAQAQDQKTIAEAGRLLFRNFRSMSPPAAAFEFYMDCLDNDG
ncbi:hypothetical protein ACVBEF_01000 [Glaciimonas sp. GG7]